MNHIFFLSTSPEILVEELNTHLNKNILLILGLCHSEFDGRIKSTLNSSDRFLIVKNDGAIILHDPIGLKPIQWQKPSAGPIKFLLTDENELKMETFRPKTNENFSISFQEIHSALAYNTISENRLVSIFGDEKDFIKFLAKNPDRIEKGLTTLAIEKETEVGYIDIFATDRSGNTVIIEVKKQQATPADAFQLQRYFNNLKPVYSTKLRGILVANSVPKRVIRQLIKYNLEYCEVPWQEIFPTVTRLNSTLKTTNLDDFF